MRKFVLTSYVASIALAIGLVGCSSDNSLTSKSASPLSFWRGKSNKKSDIKLSGQIDYNKPYQEYAAELGARPIVSPALGLEGNKPKNSIQRMASSVADSTKRMSSSVGQSLKRGAQKAGDMVTPRNATMADSISLSSPAGKPDASFFVSIARVQEVAGNLTGAEASYKQAIETDETDLEALLSYAHLLDRQGRLAEASELYQRATKHHPDSATALNDLSICYARQDMMGPSVDALTSAVRLDPQRKLYRNNLAKVLLKTNRIDEAYEQLAAVHGAGVAHYNVGYILQEMGNTEEAIRHFGYAAAADPNLVEALRWQQMLTQRQTQVDTVAADQRNHIVPSSTPVPAMPTHQALPNSSPEAVAPGQSEYRGPLVPSQVGVGPTNATVPPAYGNSLY